MRFPPEPRGSLVSLQDPPPANPRLTALVFSIRMSRPPGCFWNSPKQPQHCYSALAEPVNYLACHNYLTILLCFYLGSQKAQSEQGHRHSGRGGRGQGGVGSEN